MKGESYYILHSSVSIFLKLLPGSSTITSKTNRGKTLNWRERRFLLLCYRVSYPPKVNHAQQMGRCIVQVRKLVLDGKRARGRA
ncbi:hypothetical protein HanIR_Chr03g0144421 [Helianthus annuus]|nr:hypothetical protein HanIR_Chr03g0144421 [Helianthus annuus]